MPCNVAERILGTLAPPFSVKGNEVFLGASIGIALYPQDGADLLGLQRAADSALYAAKRQGKQRIQLSNPEISQAANRRLAMETELHHALGAQRTLGALPAAVRPGDGRHRGVGSAGAMGQPEVRAGSGVGADSDRRRERADRADRRAGAARRLPAGPAVAGRRIRTDAGGGEYLRRAIRARRPGRDRSGHSGGDGSGGLRGWTWK